MRQRFLIVAFILSAVLAVPVLAQTPNQCNDPYIPVACVYLPLLDQPSVALATPTPEPPTAIPPTMTPTPLITTPVPTTQPTVQPTPDPNTAIRIVSGRSFMRGSSRYVVGEVENTLTRPVYFVKLETRYYDDANNLVATKEGFAHLTAVFSHQRVPFTVLLTNAPPTSRQETRVISYSDQSILDYVPITVESQQAQASSSGVQVSGIVRNQNQATVRSPQLAVTFYDSNGEVVDAWFGYADGGNLTFGQGANYTITTFAMITYDHFLVQAESYIVP